MNKLVAAQRTQRNLAELGSARICCDPQISSFLKSPFQKIMGKFIGADFQGWLSMFPSGFAVLCCCYNMRAALLAIANDSSHACFPFKIQECSCTQRVVASISILRVCWNSFPFSPDPSIWFPMEIPHLSPLRHRPPVHHSPIHACQRLMNKTFYLPEWQHFIIKELW